VTVLFQSGGQASVSKRQRLSNLPEVDTALLRWFKEVHQSNVGAGITGYDLQHKAAYFAKQFDGNQGEVTMSWINRWKQRHNIVCKAICGESSSAPMDDVNNWRMSTLPAILAQYGPADVYNADETGLFWEALPTKALAFKGEQCKGGKQSKNRITILVAASMMGKCTVCVSNLAS
jgi:hypothetical protein